MSASKEEELVSAEESQQTDNEARVAELEQAVADTKDQLLRRTAEMENMRRRNQQEREQLIFEANRRLLTDLVSTLDDLERTLEHAAEANDPMTQGIELVYKNFLKVLERYGVQPMDTAGKPFDPHMHDALMQEANSEVEPGTITREIQKGYMLRDAVLRHAKVVVAKEPD